METADSSRPLRQLVNKNDKLRRSDPNSCHKVETLGARDPG